jgi:hypothetical protein
MNMVVKGKKIIVEITDPWEFQSELGKSSFIGEVIEAGLGTYGRISLCIKIKNPPIYKDALYEYLVVDSKLKGKELNKLNYTEEIPCGMIMISKEQALSKYPLNTSWWRGGHALEGSVKLLV